MSVLKDKIIRSFKNKFTIMFIPHSNSKSYTFSIPLGLIYSCCLVLFILIFSSIFLISKNLDYAQAVVNNIILENKLEYFSQEIIKNQAFLANLKDVDKQMRSLLSLHTKDAVIDAEGVGGPLAIDNINAQFLMNEHSVFSIKDFDANIDFIHKEMKLRVDSTKEIFDYIKKERSIRNSRPDIWPTTGRITDPFGFRRNPVTGRYGIHQGIDIANVYATPIHATSSGVIKYSNWLGAYGRLVIIYHGNGYSTRYGHLSKILVSSGQRVKKGDVIGLMGTTGRSTGVHLHYEVRYYNRAQNPLHYVGRRRKY